jgi:hypothetical protein
MPADREIVFDGEDDGRRRLPILTRRGESATGRVKRDPSGLARCPKVLG